MFLYEESPSELLEKFFIPGSARRPREQRLLVKSIGKFIDGRCRLAPAACRFRRMHRLSRSGLDGPGRRNRSSDGLLWLRRAALRRRRLRGRNCSSRHQTPCRLRTLSRCGLDGPMLRNRSSDAQLWLRLAVLIPFVRPGYRHNFIRILMLRSSYLGLSLHPQQSQLRYTAHLRRDHLQVGSVAFFNPSSVANSKIVKPLFDISRRRVPCLS